MVIFFLHLLFFFKSFWKNYTINRYLLELLHSKFKQLYRILLLESQMKKKIFVLTQGLNSWNYFFFFYLPTHIHNPSSHNEIPISPVQFSSMPLPSYQNFLGGKMLFPRVAPRHYGNRSNVRHKGNRIPPCTRALRLH